MFCRNCGKEVIGNPEFCPNCGVRVGKPPGTPTWKPTVAGVLDIVGGVIGILIGGVVLADDIGIGIPMCVVAIFAIIGGIFAIRRRIWGLALAGSICALLTTGILGTLAIIFVAMGKGEFE
ncbi:hypothetical protein ES703_124415 [subsurface metagenome]